MRRRKRSNISTVLVIILYISLLGSCVTLGSLGAICYKTNKELSEHKQNIEKENKELTAKISFHQEQHQTAEGEVEEQQTQETEQEIGNETEELENNEVFSQGTELAPGTIVEESLVSENIDLYFQNYDIVEGDEIFNRINGRSYRENNNISLSDLKYMKVLHYNFDHQIQVGELIANAAVSDDLLNIFKELFDSQYEVQSIYLVDNYWDGDGVSTDTASIEVNNTSCFNYREITGGGSLSNHAYGCAIDINPQQNPYVWYEGSQLRWTHNNASPYIDRNSGDSHVIVYGDVCYKIFEKYGFSWGGNWTDPIDYQHFERKK